MSMSFRRLIFISVALVLVACGDDDSGADTSPRDTAVSDSGRGRDTSVGGGRDAATDTESDAEGRDTGRIDAGTTDTGSAPPVNCDALTEAGYDVCSASADRCTTVFEDGEGCAAVCARAGLVCGQQLENIDDMCAPDLSRPALSCEGSGHRSDYCECVRDDAECVPRTCADSALNCGGPYADGCGGTFECSMCAGDGMCVDGICRSRSPGCTAADCPSFPGAEGEGRNARGGRGGDVYIVTSLGNSGSGTLREALSRGGRTVVFEVAGIIDLTSPIRADVDNVTLAGQTAPGDGIVVRGYQVELRGDHNIIQHMRFRAGDIRKATRTRDGFTEDSLTVWGDHVMVDHVSASWGIDECLSAGTQFNHLTIQYSFITEGLHRTRLFHGEYDADHSGHSMGGLYKPRASGSRLSIHHNLFAHNNNRNPAIGTYDSAHTQSADIRNNVLYDNRDNGYTSGAARWIHVNFVGNYAIFGPSSSSRKIFKPSSASNVDMFETDNYWDFNRNNRFDGSLVTSSAFESDFDRMRSPFEMEPVTTHRAADLVPLVLAQAGARPWSRDDVDARIITEVRENRGGRIDSQEERGGWGTLAAGRAPVDADRDGMPDAAERMLGTNPSVPDNNGDVDGDGYTNLENYLHWAARLTR